MTAPTLNESDRLDILIGAAVRILDGDLDDEDTAACLTRALDDIGLPYDGDVETPPARADEHTAIITGTIASLRRYARAEAPLSRATADFIATMLAKTVPKTGN